MILRGILPVEHGFTTDTLAVINGGRLSKPMKVSEADINEIGLLMGGAILTETIFSWPGIGKWMIDSISKRDYVSVQSGLLLIALIVMAVNLLVDILYAVINPRIRVQ